MSTPPHESEIVSFRLSPQQERLHTQGGAPVSQIAAELRGPLDGEALHAALCAAVERHEILRTAVLTPAGMRAPQQVVHDRLDPVWGTAGDATALLDDPAALANLLAREAGGVDAQAGPLVRGLLAGAGAERALLVLTTAASSADPTSLLALLDEVAGAGAPGDGAEPIQYADYAEWRHQLIGGEEDTDAQEGRAHWSAESEDAPAALRLLFGNLEGELSEATTATPIALDDATLEALPRAAEAAGAGVAVFLEAAWHAVIGRLSGAGELAIARWLDGRGQADLAGAIGPYAQAVPVRSRCEAGTSFAEIVDQVLRGGVQAARWQDYAGAAELAHAAQAAPVAFAHHEIGAPAPPLIAVRSLSAPLPAAPLLLHCVGRAGGIHLELRHDPAAFDARDAGEIAARFATLLASAVADPTQRVSSLAVMDAAERSLLLAGAAGGPAAGDAAIPVHERFAEQARRTPDRCAVSGASGSLRYAELNGAANRLARHLRAAGVSRGDAVGLCMERTPAMMTALLAILKAGGAYVPLNYEHPPARLAEQLAQAQARLLVTQEALLDRAGSFAGSVVCVERDAAQIDAADASDPEPLVTAEDLAYVMYTSGSTGVPKGVEVTHANLANYTAFMVERLGARGPDDGEGPQFAVVSAISTDLGNTAIFPSLVAGGTIHLVDPQAAMDGDSFAAHAAAHPLDVLKVTPSHLRALLGGSRPAAVLPRRWLVMGGEALSWDLVARIRELAPSCRLMNHYGPTETTVGCATHDVEGAARADAATVPIGRPIAATQAYVLDTELEPVPAGVPGELYVGGAGVAAGYAGNPAETAERFVRNPFASGEGARMYRTGDRARVLRDGAIEFLGRVDDQVKIRGFRIEPGEIEVALARHPQIRQAAVAVEETAPGERRLVAYLVASEEPTVEELQAHLAGSLPDYMIPSAFATLEALPFTPSGKIDRRALAGLVAVQTRREAKFVAPRDEIEEEIASIWSELLGVERVGVFDDFFALGGHSLLATQAIIRIRRSHGDIPLRALLAAPTVATLADVVRSAAAVR